MTRKQLKILKEGLEASGQKKEPKPSILTNLIPILIRDAKLRLIRLSLNQGTTNKLDETISALVEEKRTLNNSIHSTPYGHRQGKEIYEIVNRLEYVKETLVFARKLKNLEEYKIKAGIK